MNNIRENLSKINPDFLEYYDSFEFIEEECKKKAFSCLVADLKTVHNHTKLQIEQSYESRNHMLYDILKEKHRIIQETIDELNEVISQ